MDYKRHAGCQGGVVGNRSKICRLIQHDEGLKTSFSFSEKSRLQNFVPENPMREDDQDERMANFFTLLCEDNDITIERRSSREQRKAKEEQ